MSINYTHPSFLLLFFHCTPPLPPLSIGPLVAVVLGWGLSPSPLPCPLSLIAAANTAHPLGIDDHTNSSSTSSSSSSSSSLSATHRSCWTNLKLPISSATTSTTSTSSSSSSSSTSTDRRQETVLSQESVLRLLRLASETTVGLARQQGNRDKDKGQGQGGDGSSPFSSSSTSSSSSSSSSSSAAAASSTHSSYIRALQQQVDEPPSTPFLLPQHNSPLPSPLHDSPSLLLLFLFLTFESYFVLVVSFNHSSPPLPPYNTFTPLGSVPCPIFRWCRSVRVLPVNPRPSPLFRSKWGYWGYRDVLRR